MSAPRALNGKCGEPEWYRENFLVSVRETRFLFFGGMNVQTCIAETQRDFDGRERAEVLEASRDLQEDR
jgi:hypothetical protein